MQSLTILVFLAATLGTYLTSIHLAPGLLKYVPEGLSVIVLGCVVVAGSRPRLRCVAPRYLIVVGALAVIFTCSVVTSSIAPGPLISGIRFYVRAIPMFFLP